MMHEADNQKLSTNINMIITIAAAVHKHLATQEIVTVGVATLTRRPALTTINYLYVLSHSHDLLSSKISAAKFCKFKLKSSYSCIRT